MRRVKLSLSIVLLSLVGILSVLGQGTQPGPAGLKPMTYADLERLYLDGKISAKQYQRLLNEIKSRPQPPASVPQPKNQSTPTAAVQPAPLPPTTNKEDKINEVESKMDALI